MLPISFLKISDPSKVWLFYLCWGSRSKWTWEERVCRILCRTAWPRLQQSGLLPTELKDRHSVLCGLIKPVDLWWKVSVSRFITHTKKQKPQLLLTFSCHIRVPPTAEVKFHQEPKQWKSRVIRSSKPQLGQYNYMSFGAVPTLFERITLHFGNIAVADWVPIELPLSFSSLLKSYFTISGNIALRLWSPGWEEFLVEKCLLFDQKSASGNLLIISPDFIL